MCLFCFVLVNALFLLTQLFPHLHQLCFRLANVSVFPHFLAKYAVAIKISDALWFHRLSIRSKNQKII